MLGARIASAVVLIPLVLFMLWAGPETTALMAGAGAIIATYEFYTIAARSPYQFRPLYLPGYVAAAAFCVAGYWRNPGLILLLVGLLAVAILPALWLTGRLLTVTSPTTVYNETEARLFQNWGITLFAPVYAGVPLALLTLVRADRPNQEAIWWLVLVCLGTWGTDTGAYAFGRMFGRHKLAPTISPKKTIEGAVGGIAVGMLGVTLVGELALHIPLYLSLPLGLVVTVGSIAGDLFESWVKRKFDTKDSGKLIPGHGGLLDRIDSFLVVAVLVYLFIILYG